MDWIVTAAFLFFKNAFLCRSHLMNDWILMQADFWFMYLIFSSRPRRVALKWTCKVLVALFISANFFRVWYILTLACILVAACFSNRNLERVSHARTWLWIMITARICFTRFRSRLPLYNDCSTITHFLRWRKCSLSFLSIINALKILWISTVEFRRSKNRPRRITPLINAWIRIQASLFSANFLLSMNPFQADCAIFAARSLLSFRFLWLANTVRCSRTTIFRRFLYHSRTSRPFLKAR